MKAGVNSNNTSCDINVCKLVKSMGDIASSLPAIQCFSAFDYTARFGEGAKLRSPNMLRHQRTIILLYSWPENMIVLSEKIVCKAYGKPQMSSVNKSRYAIFRQKYAATNASEPLAKIKTADSSALPPCRKELIQKLKHCNYLCCLHEETCILE